MIQGSSEILGSTRVRWGGVIDSMDIDDSGPVAQADAQVGTDEAPEVGDGKNDRK